MLSPNMPIYFGIEYHRTCDHGSYWSSFLLNIFYYLVVVLSRSCSSSWWWFCLSDRSTVYRSRTVFEGATPELVRDFFWDDEFRPKWDPMLAYFNILKECPHTGTMVVHWIKKVWRAADLHICDTLVLPCHFLFQIIYALLPCFALFCSSLFSAAIENISLVEEYGRQEGLIIVWRRYCLVFGVPDLGFVDLVTYAVKLPFYSLEWSWLSEN